MDPGSPWEIGSFGILTALEMFCNTVQAATRQEVVAVLSIRVHDHLEVLNGTPDQALLCMTVTPAAQGVAMVLGYVWQGLAEKAT